MLPSSIAITVAGTASPSGVKICVMPAFVPNIPSDGTPARAETVNLRLLLGQQRVCLTQGKERPNTAVCMVADMFGSVQRDYLLRLAEVQDFSRLFANLELLVLQNVPFLSALTP